MLPQSMGGVVDAKLRVYGVSNLRVVDASVFPIEWAAHMMAPTYGLAEKAAEIIAADYSSSFDLNSNNGNGNDDSNGNNSGDSNSNGNGNGNGESKGASAKVTIRPVHLVFVVLLGAITSTL
jgi:choline dehydrogenase